MAIQYLHDLNINYNELQNAKLHVTSATPTAVKGVIYFDDAVGVQKLKFHDGSGWKTLETEGGDDNKFLSSLAFDTTDGIITATMTDSSTVTVDLDGRYSLSTHAHAFSSITSKPTTIDGYGITDALVLGTSATTALAGNTTTISSSQATAISTNSSKVSFPGFGTSSGTALEGDTSLLQIGTTSTTALAGNTAVDDVSEQKLKDRLAALDASDTLFIGDNGNDATISIRGNLTVAGTTTTINTETVTIQDNIIQLNSNSASTPTENAGLEVERGNSSNVRFLWDEGTDRWTPVGGESYGTKGNISAGTLYADTLDVTNYGLVASDIPALAASKITTGTLPVSRGGTNATSFTDKSVVITQDSSTDTLSAVAMSSAGQLLIGGSDGPAVATLTAGSNVTITNDNNAITIASSISTSDVNTLIDARSSAHTITGDASDTTFTINYGFTAAATNDVMIQVVDSSGDHDGDTVFAEVERVDTGRCQIKFASAPANGKTYRVLCFKIA